MAQAGAGSGLSAALDAATKYVDVVNQSCSEL